MSNKYDAFLPYVKKGGHILDAGCGSGRDSLYFKGKGYKVTSFDASTEMVRLSSQLLGQETYQMTFQDLNFSEEKFDAIWACASLLHVSMDEIDDVLEKLAYYLKYNGVMYASFKYGNETRKKGERLFQDYNEKMMERLLEKHPTLVLKESWVTPDVREGREAELWLNIILSKVKS